MKIISLLASGTEIVCALGAGEWLVGRSHECDNSAWVRELPQCSDAAFDTTGTSRAIDTEVRRRMRAGEPMYTLDYERMNELEADLLIAQEHCEVCAITPGTIVRSGCVMPAAQVMALSAGTLDGVFAGMQQVADALGLHERGRALVASERARLEAVRTRCAGKPTPSVTMIEWIEPIFCMANWGPELVAAANGELRMGKPGAHSAAVGWELVRESDPEVLVVAPCGFTLERALAERAALESLPGWSELRAVKAGKVAYADGNLYFNRSGMTVVRTAEILAEMLHGEVFSERSEGSFWHWVSR